MSIQRLKKLRYSLHARSLASSRWLVFVVAQSCLCSCSFISDSLFDFGSAAPSKPGQCGPKHVEHALMSTDKRLYVPSRADISLPELRLERRPEVEAEIRRFGRGEQTFVAKAIEKREPYLPSLTKIFFDEGVPLQFLNLALIESGFDASARSPSGAVGMWQFMKSTARLYGLRIGFFVDERKDPVLSTIAAARHLKDLYNNYKDWHLVLAAYNAGSGAVDRAIKETGSTDFWTIARSGRLSNQTVRFVPKFIAAALLVHEHSADSNLAQSLSRVEEKSPAPSGMPSNENWSGLRYTSAG